MYETQNIIMKKPRIGIKNKSCREVKALEEFTPQTRQWFVLESKLFWIQRQQQRVSSNETCAYIFDKFPRGMKAVAEIWKQGRRVFFFQTKDE